jgi:hypothetical protein
MGLRDQKLAISNGLQPDDEVVTSHDRVRETIVGGMAVEPKKQVHLRLAVALEASGMADPETLAAHFVGGDEPYGAAAYYEAAADRAAGKLAFDRAAKLYDVAAVLRPLKGEPGTAFRTKHAEALANAEGAARPERPTSFWPRKPVKRDAKRAGCSGAPPTST